MAPGTAPPSIVEQLSGMGKVRSAWLDESRRAPDAGADAAADRDAAAPPAAHAPPTADADARAEKKSKKKSKKKKRAREETAAGDSSDSSGGYASGDEASEADAAQGEGKGSSSGSSSKKGKSKKKKKGKKRARVDSGGDSGYDEEEESAEERGAAPMDAAATHVPAAPEADAVAQEGEGAEEPHAGGTAAHVRALEAWLDTREATVSLPARKDIAKLGAPAQRAFAEHMGDASMRAVLALQQLLEMSAALVESGADGDGATAGGRGAAHGKLSDVMLHEIETNRSLPERRQFVEMGLWRRAHRISTALCKPVHVLLRAARTKEAAAAAEAAATATFEDVYNAAFAGTFGDEVERLGEVDGQRLSALLDAVQQSGHMLADVEKQLMVRQHAAEQEAEA